MSAADEAKAILEPAATRVRDPQSGRSVWLAGMIKEGSIKGDMLSFTLACTRAHSSDDRSRLQDALLRNIESVGWKGQVQCSIAITGGAPDAEKPAEPKGDAVRGMSGPGMGAHGGPVQKQPLPGVKHIVAVASGKGGVGKSTVATNLAVALRGGGFRVGLMDADIYGPSLPMMMHVTGKPMANEDKKIVPLEAYGVQCISIGFLVDEKEPIIWRGPMVMGVVRQFLHDVAWDDLDFLIVDLPPGTGDAQLTMIQAVPIAGAVIVTTPQDVAVLDAVRGIEMFRKLDVPVFGIVENMSWLDVPGGGRMYPFGEGGGQRVADDYGVALLAKIPLDGQIRAGGDAGRPAALDTEAAGAPFVAVAASVAVALGM